MPEPIQITLTRDNAWALVNEVSYMDREWGTYEHALSDPARNALAKLKQALEEADG